MHCITIRLAHFLVLLVDSHLNASAFINQIHDSLSIFFPTIMIANATSVIFHHVDFVL